MTREFDFATASRDDVARHFACLGHTAQRLSLAANEAMTLTDARFLYERARDAVVIGQVRGAFAGEVDCRLGAITRRIEESMLGLGVHCGHSASDALFVVQALTTAAKIQRGRE